MTTTSPKHVADFVAWTVSKKWAAGGVLHRRLDLFLQQTARCFPTEFLLNADAVCNNKHWDGLLSDSRS